MNESQEVRVYQDIEESPIFYQYRIPNKNSLTVYYACEPVKIKQINVAFN